MKHLRAFGAFWYDFIIGDSWEVAAGVVIALGAVWALVSLRPSLSEALGPLLGIAIAAVMGVSLRRE